MSAKPRPIQRARSLSLFLLDRCREQPPGRHHAARIGFAAELVQCLHAPQPRAADQWDLAAIVLATLPDCCNPLPDKQSREAVGRLTQLVDAACARRT